MTLSDSRDTPPSNPNNRRSSVLVPQVCNFYFLYSLKQFECSNFTRRFNVFINFWCFWWFQHGGPKFWKLFNFHENLYTLAFWVADFEYAVRFPKFKIVDSIWRQDISKNFQFLWKFVYRCFRGCWLWMCRQIFKIKNSSSNMAAQIMKTVLFTWKSHENLYTVSFRVTDFEFLIFMKIFMWGFSGKLMGKPLSRFENKKRRF